MIYPAKYNQINFSPDFTRDDGLYNYSNQRVKDYIADDYGIPNLVFFSDSTAEPTNVSVLAHYRNSVQEITADVDPFITITNGFVIILSIPFDTLTIGEDVFFSVNVDGVIVYSEIYKVTTSDKMPQLGYISISANNNDDKHGFISKGVLAFFKASKFKSDIFLNKKIEYEYSYSRKKILSSENQIGKRFTFHDLTMYNSNLLKWLCNCENLSIDGVSYQKISDFNELESDLNSEIVSLQADFVEAEQSFFTSGAQKPPVNIFTKNFYM